MMNNVKWTFMQSSLATNFNWFDILNDANINSFSKYGSKLAEQ